MRRLLRLQYGREVELRESGAPGAIRDLLNSYFAGDFSALDFGRGRDRRHAISAQALGGVARHPLRPNVELRRARRENRPAESRARRRRRQRHNPISIVLPCHRVIGSDQRLTGYGGGLHRKRWLLTHEGAAFRG